MQINKRYFKTLSTVLVFILFFNIFIFAVAGNTRVKAGIWDDNKDGLMLVVKGIIMFWIINIMSKNNTGEETNESFLTSTIKNSLNIGNEGKENIVEKEKEAEDKVETEENIDIMTQEVSIIDEMEEKENEMLKLINEAREKIGLNKLKKDNSLRNIARVKAEDMINNNYFDHYSPTFGTPFEMIQAEGIDYGLAGENLAEATSIEKAFEQLMNSNAHRENILEKRYDKVGIGVKRGGEYGLMIVQLFIDLPDPAQ